MLAQRASGGGATTEGDASSHPKTGKPEVSMLAASFVLAVAVSQVDLSSVLDEKPPCRGAPLGDDQVLDIARGVLGDAFMHPRGMPPRPWQVRALGCVYDFEYVALSHERTWFGFDAIDGTGWLVVTRDGSVYRNEMEAEASGWYAPPAPWLQITAP